MYNLYIIKDENFEDWQAFEIHQVGGRRVLYTLDWNEVLRFFGNDIPTPEVVMVG